MSNTINFINFKQGSYKAKLKALYDDLETSKIHMAVDSSQRATFFKKAQGRFIKTLRERCGFPPVDVAEKIGMNVEEYSSLEDGVSSITDWLFFKLAHIFKATNEASVFLEKIEEAFHPELKKGRVEMAQTLKQYGFEFADSEKYDSSSKGQVVQFASFKKRQ